LLLPLSLAYIFLYQNLIPRVSAFGCFDDCFNYLGGYFLLKGKVLYSEIFFNHQPLMAYLSAVIQSITQPGSVFELLLRHRQAILAFSFFANAFLILRFGWLAFGFATIYELSKFYLFGDRFLAEGLVVYLLVYLFGLAWLKISRKRIYRFEYFFAVLVAWSAIFLRLPYLPVGLFLLGVIFWEKGWFEKRKWAMVFLGGLVIASLLALPIKEYNFNLISVNQQTGRLGGFNLLKSFFYPIWLISNRQDNLFARFLWSLDLVFLGLLLSWGILGKRKKLVLILATLGSANLILVNPGRIFYEAFHLLPWYGLLLFAICLILKSLLIKKRKLGAVLLVVIIISFGLFISSPQYFAWESVDPHHELMTNYSREIHAGIVVKDLSGPEDTLFLDGYDDLIYWQADRLSLYPYSWYTSVMPKIERYALARLEMFKTNPSDFYYGACHGEAIEEWTMPMEFRQNYRQLYSEDQPTCLWVHQDKIEEISEQQWQKAKELFYELPSVD